MFVNGSGQNEQSLERTFHRCFLPSFTSFGWGVSEEKIKMWKVNRRRTPSNGKSSHCLSSNNNTGTMTNNEFITCITFNFCKHILKTKLYIEFIIQNIIVYLLSYIIIILSWFFPQISVIFSICPVITQVQ
jgi:hypothetical protein